MNRIHCLLSLGATIAGALPLFGGMLLGGFEGENEIRAVYPAISSKWYMPDAGLSQKFVTQGQSSARIVFPGRDVDYWPEIHTNLTPEEGDWRSSDYFAFDLGSDNPEEIVVFVRFEFERDDASTGAFDASFLIKPGTQNRHAMKLSDFRDEINLGKVRHVKFYTACPRLDQILYFDNVRLENEADRRPLHADDGPREIAVGPMARTPVIDGNITPQEWSGAVKATGFRNTYNGAPTTEATTAYVGGDGENFYFAFDCSESQMDRLVARYTEDGAPVWSDDSIELFLDPGQSDGRYYYFAFNSTGAKLSTLYEHGVIVDGWRADWEAAAATDSRGWKGEVKIPFHVFDFDGGRPPEWKINLCREERPHNEVSALFPTMGGLHSPGRFGRLTGVDVDFRRFFYRKSMPDFGDKRLGDNTVTLQIENLTGSASRNIVHTVLTAPDGTVQESQSAFPLTEGTNTFAFPYAIHQDGQYCFSWAMTDEEGGTLLRSAEYRFSPPPPLQLELIEPAYRNTIYATQSLDAVQGRVRINVEDSLMHGQIAVALVDAAETTLYCDTVALETVGNAFDIAISAWELPVGDYKIELALQNASGGETYVESSTPLRKVPPAGREVRLDGDNNLVVDGKPVFPIGIWWPEANDKVYSELKEAGFNTVLQILWADWENSPIVGRATRETFAMAKKYDMGVVVDTRGQPSITPEVVARYGNLNNLLLWSIGDEDNANFKEPQADLVDAYRVFSENDPYHPVYFNGYSTGNLGNYGSICDVLSFDWYPRYSKTEGVNIPLSVYENQVRDARRQVNDRRPVWVIASDIEYGRDLDPLHYNYRLPNYRENRLIAYLCVIGGAKGFWWWTCQWGLNSIFEHPEWVGIKAVARELSALSPVILAREISGRAHAGDAGVSLRLLEYNDDLFLLAANPGLDARDVTIRVEAAPDTAWQVLGEERSVHSQHGEITDRFEPYAVHVYTTATDYQPRIDSVAGVEAAENHLREEHNRKVERNVFTRAFFHDSGITYKESSKHGKDDLFNPSWATDGLEQTVWMDGTPDQWPDWLELTLAQPETINTVVISGNLRDYELSVLCDGRWEILETVTSNAEKKRTHHFPARTITGLKIDVTGCNPFLDIWWRAQTPEYTNICEIEGYLE